jgi:hypothetical protein
MTPDSETLNKEVEALKNAVAAVVKKLSNRVGENKGEWTIGHRLVCADILDGLNKLIIKLDEL